MAPLHPFLLQSISRVRHFLDQLVDVDGEEGESLVPATSGLSLYGPSGPAFPHPTPRTETVDQWVSYSVN